VRLGVLVSGSGSNLQAILDRVQAGHVPGTTVALVLANDPAAYGLTRARNAGVPTACVDHRGFSSRQDFDAELVRRLVDAGVDTVALAGFMRILTPVFLEAFAGRVLNIHPAILPAFPGVHAQGQQADYGVRLAGCTVHFVDEHMDHGPIIIQAAVPATPQDTPQRLGERILALEHRIYPQALAWLASGRITVRGRQVEVAGADYAGGGRYWTVPTLEPPFDVDWAAAS